MESQYIRSMEKNRTRMREMTETHKCLKDSWSNTYSLRNSHSSCLKTGGMMCTKCCCPYNFGMDRYTFSKYADCHHNSQLDMTCHMLHHKDTGRMLRSAGKKYMLIGPHCK